MKISRLVFNTIGAVALIASCGTACADSFPEKNGYLIDSRGIVARNSYRECWRTGYWTPSLAIAECDPDLVKKVKQAESSSPAPAPVAPRETMAPAAPEKPAVAAAAPVAAAYFNAETLFDFDKAVIKPEGRKLLDEKIVSGMRMHPEITLLIITGYADRIGTEEYNRNLSERRASAVKAYLMKQGIAAERMRTSGKGESEPDPQANTMQACKGKRGHQLIACLQPDRRVTVEPQKQAPAR